MLENKGAIRVKKKMKGQINLIIAIVISTFLAVSLKAVAVDAKSQVQDSTTTYQSQPDCRYKPCQ